MDAWLEEEHNEFISSRDLYPRLFDVEYEWWVANAARPALGQDEIEWFNEQKI